MRTVSGSRRWVVKRDWPGRRRSSQCWISGSVSAMRGGMPSTTQPIAGPWLSPQVVTRNSVPKLFADMGSAVRGGGLEPGKHLRELRCRVDREHADDVIAAVDVHHLAGDATAKVAQQE